MALFGYIPRSAYQQSPLFRLTELIGFTYEDDTDPQWEDTLVSETFPELLDGLVFYGVVTETQGRILEALWNEREGTVDEYNSEVLLMEVMFTLGRNVR